MKKINFQDLSIKKKIFILTFLLIGLIFMFLNMFEINIFKNSKIDKIIIVVFFVILSLHSSRIFWGKNVVQWNKKGIAIRINEYLGKSITFENISKIQILENEILIHLFNGKNYKINLKNINSQSKHKLIDVLKSNSRPSSFN